jgi:hypothetical protein
MTDNDFLDWIYARMVKVHNENELVDYMRKFEDIIKKGKMTETDISTVLIEGDIATIMGVKYKRVEEPKPPTLLHILCEWCDDDIDLPCGELVDMIEEWLPDELEYDGEEYHLGWNDALRTIKDKLR